MRKALSIFLILLLNWQLPVQAGIVIYWKVNQQRIAMLECENKSRPALHCNGKCFLQKQIDRSTEQETGKELPAGCFRLSLTDAFDVNAQPVVCCTVINRVCTFSEEVNLDLLRGYRVPVVQPPDMRFS